MRRVQMWRCLTFAAMAVLLSVPQAWAQYQKPISSSTPPPKGGQRIEAHDGDTVFIRDGGRVRVVRRSEANVRAIYNAAQRWLVLLIDYVDPATSAPDGKVDANYRFDDVDAAWPLGDRWEGSAVIDDYSFLQGPAAGIGMTTNTGLIQLFTVITGNQWFRDSRAVAALTYKAGGHGNSPAGRWSFDEAEAQYAAEATRSAENRAMGRPSSSTTTFTGPNGASMTSSLEVVPGSAPVRIGGSIGPPRKLLDVRPAYPPEAQAARITGIVILEAVIGTDGRVTDARVLRSIPLLDTAAIEAVRQWRYEPTMLDRKPVPVIMTVTVNFSLQ